MSGTAHVSNDSHVVQALRSLLQRFMITRWLLRIAVLTDDRGAHNSIISGYQIL